MERSTLLQIPKQGFSGLAALVQLGHEGAEKLASWISDQKLTFDLEDVSRQMSEGLGLEEDICAAILSTLVPLNGLRLRRNAKPDAFVALLTESIERQAPDEWKKRHLSKWKKTADSFTTFFLPNNFFALTYKVHELLTSRPSILSEARLLTELRPVYNEDATQTKALLLTNTLALTYYHDERMHSLHLNLDFNDLKTLRREIDRAFAKYEQGIADSIKWGIELVSFEHLET